MSIVLDGTTGITTPGLTNTGTETIVNLTTTGNTVLGDASTDTLNVGNGGLVKDASGNVGIGTASPNLSGAGNGKFLTILGAGATTTAASGRIELANPNTPATENECGSILFEQVGNNSSVRIASIGGTTTGSGGANGFGGYLTFYTKGDNVAGAPSERMRIDSSGNVGIGVTPSAWFTSNNLKAMQLGGGSLVSYLNNQVWLASNYYLNSSGQDTYVGTGASNRLIMDGAYKFFTAASGTAGNAISFTQAMTLDSSGNLLVGTTGTNSISGNTVQITSGTQGQLVLRQSSSAAGKCWRLGPDSSGNNLVVFNQNGIGVYIVDGGTSWTGTSDERVKDIIEPITGAIEKLSGLRTVIGKYKTDEEGTRRSFLIAQDVQAVFPEAIHEKDDELGTLGLAYTDMIPVMVKAIQEMKAIIDTQASTITQLQADVAALKGTP